MLDWCPGGVFAGRGTRSVRRLSESALELLCVRDVRQRLAQNHGQA